ncbi:hypothetical protein Q4566_03505 [Tamlana sp. 2_MG-2023]|uniref:universal stress protein n=1 Tax=unclassified Tamlana TaxID=2614803 RepID=UPI0026E30C51|nr:MULTISPECIES: universal stress protein [unclassified Tamlana]MDO6759253.1 hypothetical protein [Tamlana sp. 2_MG-2023]MDO6790608.1 hypothetical protein [Tamlana sp. 1_MG-2023]
MKNILIPTDFSQDSNRTIDYVTMLFKNESCAFYFLNTYTYDISGLNALDMLQADDEWFDKPKEDSLLQLNDLLISQRIRKNYSNHEYHIISECSSLAKGIEKQLETLDIDLVVLKGDTKLGRKSKSIIGNIRTCPVLLVPVSSAVDDELCLTITSNFKEKIRMFGVNRFLEALKNTNLKINILVLGEKKLIGVNVKYNIDLLLNHLKEQAVENVKVEYTGNAFDLKAYASTHLNNIMCVMDEKPDFLRRVGLSHSSVIPTLENLHNNTVLTIHQ